ncbi:MAG: hypothetical protein WKG01_42420 [Kofleriaceae bacterium]
MMRTLAIVVVAACGSRSHATVIENVEPAGSRAPPCVGRLTGRLVITGVANEPVLATLVASSQHHDELGTEVSITDGDGAFSLRQLGHDTLTIYHDDLLYTGPLPSECKRVTIEIDTSSKVPVSGAARPFRVRHD